MKGIIFDMDGTMIDNMKIHHLAWQKKLSDLGLEMTYDEVHQKVHGVNIEILERLFGDQYSLKERYQISEEKELEYQRIFEPQLKLINGLPELIHELKRKNIPMGIGSAAPPMNVDFVMNKLDLWHYFQAVKHSEDVTHGKPHPEVYLKVMEDMEIEPKECLIFEDTPAGAESAHRAGCNVVLVTTTHTPIEFEGNPSIVKFISDFTQVTVDEILAY